MESFHEERDEDQNMIPLYSSIIIFIDAFLTFYCKSLIAMCH